MPLFKFQVWLRAVWYIIKIAYRAIFYILRARWQSLWPNNACWTNAGLHRHCGGTRKRIIDLFFLIFFFGAQPMQASSTAHSPEQVKRRGRRSGGKVNLQCPEWDRRKSLYPNIQINYFRLLVASGRSTFMERRNLPPSNQRYTCSMWTKRDHAAASLIPPGLYCVYNWALSTPPSRKTHPPFL